MKKYEFDYAYAKLIVSRLINTNDNKKLLIIIDNMDTMPLVKDIMRVLKTKNISDISLDIKDNELLHDYLINTSLTKIKLNYLLDYSLENEYAKNKDNILYISSPIPGLMNDIDPNKLVKMDMIKELTRPNFNELLYKLSFQYGEAVYPNKKWANKVLPNTENSYGKLFYQLFNCTMLNLNHPGESWNESYKELNFYKKVLNYENIDKLLIKNNRGTDLEIGLPDNYLFNNLDNRKILHSHKFNSIPNYKLNTSVDRWLTNGIVYNSKPININNAIIDKFYLYFKDGKIKDFDAKVGKDYLEKIIKEYLGANYLGQLSFVDEQSPLLNDNINYYNNILDTNSAISLTLGKCNDNGIKNGLTMDKWKLIDNNLNTSDYLFDIPIGTDDMTVDSINGECITRLLTNGKFNIKKSQ